MGGLRGILIIITSIDTVVLAKAGEALSSSSGAAHLRGVSKMGHMLAAAYSEARREERRDLMTTEV
jgi:hypothetical protein